MSQPLPPSIIDAVRRIQYAIELSNIQGDPIHVRHLGMAHSTVSHVPGLLKHWAHYLGLRRFKSSKVTSIFTMDYIFAQSTWLVKALLSVLQLFFSPAFSSLDSQPTWPLGKENAGLLQSCLAPNLFCFMDYIHDQLTRLLQNETTLFKKWSSCSFSYFQTSSFLYLFSSLCLTDLSNKGIEVAHPTQPSGAVKQAFLLEKVMMSQKPSRTLV